MTQLTLGLSKQTKIENLLASLDLGKATICEDGAVLYKYTLSLDEELFFIIQVCKDHNLEVRISPVLIKERFGVETSALSILIWEKEE